VILQQVWTRSFRNLEDPRVEISPRTTVLFGQNG
jgi:recombinational DNA repair ATPase RecF